MHLLMVSCRRAQYKTLSPSVVDPTHSLFEFFSRKLRGELYSLTVPEHLDVSMNTQGQRNYMVYEIPEVHSTQQVLYGCKV